MNKIQINGLTIETDGNCISVKNGRVVVDGKQIDIKDNVRDVFIVGNVGSIECDGKVEVKGDVTGNIGCGGSCSCRDVYGSIDAGGSVRANNVKHNIDAGGSVHINER